MGKNNAGLSTAWTLALILFLLLLVTEAGLFYLLGKHGYINISNFGKKDEVEDTFSPTATKAPEKNIVILNKDYIFPIKDASAKKIGEFKYTLADYQKVDEIIIKGQRATAIEGRTFLIVNIRVSHNLDRVVELDTKDYLRLSKNNETNRLSADIHNDPVEVKVNASHNTKLGFPINDSDTNLVLLVGEPEDQKDRIELY